ncbi:hypothetical protein [Vibrio agarivorans]|uniref:Regulatory protein RecX n=2 Tax=Vibrio agarivorans TaxID=153622 RepID=A0ABT7Y4A7_9VIBR|nr:hypothetical protein [Vibrio agarivorans]MDN2482860.1 hypothetical protein [Vibrio agarivorans]
MARAVNPADKMIIQLLQRQGYIKSEAEKCLKRDVYQLKADEVAKVKNYATHFGIQAKQKIIDEILELRREALIGRLNRELSAQMSA